MSFVFRAFIFLFLISFFHASVVADGNDFGRLFTTPEEREKLDKLRHALPSSDKKTDDVTPVVSQVVTQSEAKTSGGIHLSGVVIRSDGREQVWLNGKLLIDNAGVGAEIKKIDDVVIKTSSSTSRESQAHLKVGQKWLPATNKVVDVYSSKNE